MLAYECYLKHKYQKRNFYCLILFLAAFSIFHACLAVEVSNIS